MSDHDQRPLLELLGGDEASLKRLVDEDSERLRASRAKAVERRKDPPERTILHAIERALAREPGVWVLRYSAGLVEVEGRKLAVGTPGHSDLAGVVTMASGLGRAFYLEVKASKGVLTERQQWFLEKARAHGAAAYVVRSVAEALSAVRAARAGEVSR